MDKNNLTSHKKYHKFFLLNIFADDWQAAHFDVRY